MQLKKNLGPGQRAARIIGGLLMIACGLVPLHAGPVGILFALAGAFALLTGLARHCPVCALGGKNEGGC